MTTEKKFFHDHVVLLLLSVNVFLAAACSIFVVLRLATSHGNGYIVQYRPSLGINAYQTGSLIEILSFIAFALLVLVAHSFLSARAYYIHRQLAIVILTLGMLLLVMGVIVANSLLLLR